VPVIRSRLISSRSASDLCRCHKMWLRVWLLLHSRSSLWEMHVVFAWRFEGSSDDGFPVELEHAESRVVFFCEVFFEVADSCACSR
jgi:hypothetical protein